MSSDTRSATIRELDDAVWRTLVPDRTPADVAEALRSWGVMNARDGATVLVREADPANIERTAGLDPLDPDGGPLEPNVLTWSLANTLRYRAGMTRDPRLAH